MARPDISSYRTIDLHSPIELPDIGDQILMVE